MSIPKFEPQLVLNLAGSVIVVAMPGSDTPSRETVAGLLAPLREMFGENTDIILAADYYSDKGGADVSTIN